MQHDTDIRALLCQPVEQKREMRALAAPSSLIPAVVCCLQHTCGFPVESYCQARDHTDIGCTAPHFEHQHLSSHVIDNNYILGASIYVNFIN